MTRLNVSDLPPEVRARVEAQLGEKLPARESDGHRQGAAGPPVPYRCVACGFRFDWTTRGDATPAAVVSHQAEHPTHRRYEQVVA